jgi:hypothetical protein
MATSGWKYGLILWPLFSAGFAEITSPPLLYKLLRWGMEKRGCHHLATPPQATDRLHFAEVFP